MSSIARKRIQGAGIIHSLDEERGMAFLIFRKKPVRAQVTFGQIQSAGYNQPLVGGNVVCTASSEPNGDGVHEVETIHRYYPPK